MKNIYEYLKERNFNPELYNQCWVNEGECKMTVPIYSFDKRLIGYQEYRPIDKKGHRYYTNSSEQSVWGLNEIPPDYKGVVFLTEALFRSNVLHERGLPTMSLLGSTCSKQFGRFLRDHPIYDFVWIGDPDKSGRFMLKYLPGECSPKDLDELGIETDDYILKLKERYYAKPCNK